MPSGRLLVEDAADPEGLADCLEAADGGVITCQAVSSEGSISPRQREGPGRALIKAYQRKWSNLGKPGVLIPVDEYNFKVKPMSKNRIKSNFILIV